MKTRISWQSLAAVCRRVGTSLSAGLDIRTIWQREAQRGSPGHRRQMARVSGSLARGHAVTESLLETDGYFPEIVHQLVSVGERTGRLDEVFSRLADHYEHLLRLRRTFLLGILWPAIQLAAAVLIVGVLIWISGWVSQRAGQRVDLLGLGLVGTSGVIIYAVCITLAAGLGVALARGLRVKRFWARPVMWLLMRLPVLGACLRTTALERMAWALSVAAKSGLGARESARVALASTQNILYSEQIERVDRQIARGDEVHEALRLADYFTPEFIDAVEVGERTGRLEQAMDHLSREYEQRMRSSSSGLAVAAAFITWGCVALLLIALIFRLFFSYFQMTFSPL